MCNTAIVAGAKRSRTAQGVVAERAVLHARGVLDDQFAIHMLTPFWAAFVAARRRLPFGKLPFSATLAGLASRVLWYDAQVQRALNDGVPQIVVVGAGYDTRAWRFHRDGATFFELDHPVTQADKQERAARVTSSEKAASASLQGPVFVSADLNLHSAAEALFEDAFDASQRALFVVEGVTMYLRREIIESQLRQLAEVAASGSLLAIDFYPPSDVGTSLDQRQILAQKFFRLGSGEQFKFVADLPEAVELVTSCGWSVTQQLNLRQAASVLVGRDAGLPIDSVNKHKALVAAARL